MSVFVSSCECYYDNCMNDMKISFLVVIWFFEFQEVGGHLTNGGLVLVQLLKICTENFEIFGWPLLFKKKEKQAKTRIITVQKKRKTILIIKRQLWCFHLEEFPLTEEHYLLVSLF